ncbi:MAG: 1,4-dihydroxy-2-naphthoate polyprenyltransferase [Bacteroidota bacterium]
MTTSPTPPPALSPVRTWLLAARPKTLPAAAAPVVVGTAMAVEAGAFHLAAAVCALLGALFIQIGTNYANDYHDFVQGADTADRKGPVRVTQAGLASPAATKRAALLAFVLAVAAGTYLMIRGGWPIVTIGVLSLVCGWLYTAGRYSLAYLGIADLFVLAFFGPVAVAGTYYVQAVGDAAALGLLPVVVAAGLGPGLLATAILLVNNIRDVDEDRAADKRTLIVRLGREVGVRLYALCVAAAALVPVALWLWTREHALSMLAATVLPLALPAVRQLREERDAVRLNPLLGATARLLLIWSVLFSVGWVLS